MRPLSRLLPALALLACRDRASDAAASSDSAFARDLALAQQQVAPQTVFNDAPVGGTTAAAPSPEARRPEPSRARVPRPMPAPRRESTAPAARTPRPAPRAPTPVEQEPSTAPSATPAPAAGIIGAGTRLGLSSNGRACTNALAGDKFTATVTSDVAGSNGALIPAGSTVVLEVTSVERADPIGSSRIHFHVRAIDVNGEAYATDGQVTTPGQLETVRVSGGTDRTKVVGGAVAGAVLGRILGKSTKGTVIGAAAGAAAGSAASRASGGSEACLPDGSALQLTLSREIVMRRRDWSSGGM